MEHKRNNPNKELYDNVFIKGSELDPNVKIVKNKDLEHRLDIKNNNNVAEVLEIKFKNDRIYKLFEKYNEFIKRSVELDKELIIQMAIFTSHLLNNFNSDFIVTKINYISSTIDTIIIYKNDIFKRINNHKKYYPFYLVFKFNNIQLNTSINKFDNTTKAIKDNFFYLYEIEINDIFVNLIAQQNDIIDTIKKNIIYFDNKLKPLQRQKNIERESIYRSKVNNMYVDFIQDYQPKQKPKYNKDKLITEKIKPKSITKPTPKPPQSTPTVTQSTPTVTQSKPTVTQSIPTQSIPTPKQSKSIPQKKEKIINNIEILNIDDSTPNFDITKTVVPKDIIIKKSAIEKKLENQEKNSKQINTKLKKLNNEVLILKKEKELTGLTIKDEKKLEKIEMDINELYKTKIKIENSIEITKNEIYIIEDRKKIIEKRINENNFKSTILPVKTNETIKNERLYIINRLKEKTLLLVNNTILDKEISIKKKPIIKQEKAIEKSKPQSFSLLLIVIFIFLILFVISYYSKK